MYYNINIQSQLRQILKNKNIFNTNFESSEEYLTDVYDGNIYSKLLNTVDGELIKNGAAFTFTINTDGISICEKSNLDIQPVYLVINEIKKEFRYCPENVIVAGID